MANASVRTVANWRQHLASRTDLEKAEMIIGDLVGYRRTSLSRANDLDQLHNAIVAIRELEAAAVTATAASQSETTK